MRHKMIYVLIILCALIGSSWYMHIRTNKIHTKPIPELELEQEQFAQHVALLLQFIKKEGYIVTFGEAYRTPEQAILDAKEGKGIKNSLHCRRLAIDLNLFDKDGKYLGSTINYAFAGNYWESLHPHNRWGGNFVKEGGHINDPDHFERKMP